MSKENLEKFYDELKTNEELQKKAKGIKNEEEFISLAKLAGYDISIGDLKESKQGQELSDTELDNVSGGDSVINELILEVEGTTLYNKDGYLIVTPMYKCNHYKGQFVGLLEPAALCTTCEYYKLTYCSNPANKVN